MNYLISKTYNWCFYLNESNLKEIYDLFSKEFGETKISLEKHGDISLNDVEFDDKINDIEFSSNGLQRIKFESIANTYTSRSHIEIRTDFSSSTIELYLKGKEADLIHFISKFEALIKQSHYWWSYIAKHFSGMYFIFAFFFALFVSIINVAAILILFGIEEKADNESIVVFTFFLSTFSLLIVLGKLDDFIHRTMFPKAVFIIGNQKKKFNIRNKVRNWLALLLLSSIITSLGSYLYYLF